MAVREGFYRECADEALGRARSEGDPAWIEQTEAIVCALLEAANAIERLGDTVRARG